MARKVAYKNVYMTYIKNDPYNYPSINVNQISSNTHQQGKAINTGWHIIPNFMWRHFMVPRQWMDLMVNYEAYRVLGTKCTIYNPIPITSNLSLQRINTFSAFNNCSYGLTYTDDIYETSWFPWNLLDERDQLHLSNREGMLWYGDQLSGDGNAATYQKKRYYWPEYYWMRPNQRTFWPNIWSQGNSDNSGTYDCQTAWNADDTAGYISLPAGVFWDPYNRPDSIGEIRAGKNSISLEWNIHEADSHIWYNLDQLASYSHWTVSGPYCGVGRPGARVISTAMDPDSCVTYGKAEKETQGDNSTQEKYFQDYSVPNMANMPLMQTTWFWHEIKNTVIDMDETILTGDAQNQEQQWWRKPDKYWPGTEWEACKYPPYQWFIKGIPLFDENHEHIKTSTQVSVAMELILECKPRRSAYFCPTVGPFSSKQLYGHTNRLLIFQPDMIRYRTAGARRGWQNINRPMNRTAPGENAARLHPREDPYTMVASGNQQYVYGTHHRPAGIPDDQSRTYTAQGESFEADKRPHKRNIRVTFNRSSERASIEMDDD